MCNNDDAERYSIDAERHSIDAHPPLREFAAGTVGLLYKIHHLLLGARAKPSVKSRKHLIRFKTSNLNLQNSISEKTVYLMHCGHWHSIAFFIAFVVDRFCVKALLITINVVEAKRCKCLSTY